MDFKGVAERFRRRSLVLQAELDASGLTRGPGRGWLSRAAWTGLHQPPGSRRLCSSGHREAEGRAVVDVKPVITAL